MMRYIVSTILIGASVALFFTITQPFFNDISSLKAKVTGYNLALANFQDFEKERESLSNKYNSIDPNNLTRLNNFLPDNIDNIRLILEIGDIAQPYGMLLKDVQYDATNKKKTTTDAVGIAGGVTANANQTNPDYGVWVLKFSTTGTYSNFLNFIKALENNLRIVDVSSIDFDSSNTTNRFGGLSTSSQESYKYSFSIKTYWLKN